MATFTGDAMAAVERARMTESLPEKVLALEDALTQLVQELTAVLTTLGPENFSDAGRKAMRGE